MYNDIFYFSYHLKIVESDYSSLLNCFICTVFKLLFKLHDHFNVICEQISAKFNGHVWYLQKLWTLK